jgi:3-oxoacyl-[acyl-carrier protein] reductase
MSLEGRVVIVTGATGGLGQVAARQFGERGARLVLVGTSRQKLQDLAADLGHESRAALTHVANLVEPESGMKLAEAVMGAFGRIDVVLHLVGGWSGGKSIEELDAGEIDRMLQQHLWSSLHLAQGVVPHMRSARWGRFLVISSPTASRPAAKRAPYAIGKAAQEALVLTLAQELKGCGVTANLVLVESIETSRAGAGRRSRSGAAGTTPEDITATLLHLCADEAAMINGARIPLFGG